MNTSLAHLRFSPDAWGRTPSSVLRFYAKYETKVVEVQMAWYSIDMPEDSVTDGGYHRLCRQFQKAFISAGAPAELALFACRNGTSSGRRLYLTPSSPGYVPDLVQAYGAEPCDVPEAGTVTLVYGVPGAKTLLSASDEVSVLADEQDVDAVAATQSTARPDRNLPVIYSIAQNRQAASNG